MKTSSGTVTLGPQAVSELLALASLALRLNVGAVGVDPGRLALAVRQYLMPIQGMSEAGRAAAVATPERRLCPFTDYDGNPIREGDTLQHPVCGTRLVATYDATRMDPKSPEMQERHRWRARYIPDDEATPAGELLFLGFQVGPKGQAVVVKP